MNILVVFPHGNALNPHSGAETRYWNLNSALNNLNYNVTVLHSIRSLGFEDLKLKKKCKRVIYTKSLSFFGLSDYYLIDFNPFFLLRLYQITRKIRFDIIMLELPWGFLITKLIAKKNSTLIYDSQGVESELIKVTIANPKFPKYFKPFAKIFGKIYEKLVCKFADVIVCVSEIDRDYYKQNYGIDRRKTILIQTPSAIDHQYIERTESLRRKYREKLNLPLNKTIVMFHGGMPHQPNRQAFNIIENYISPKVKNPDIIFVLAGYKVDIYKKNNIISLGFVSNLRHLLYSADYAIIPLISGVGMRIKITDYIITALPFITTKKGIEGIDFVNPGEDYLVFDTVNNDFINAILKLHEDKELRQKLHKNLLKKSNLHNRKNFEKQLFKLFDKLDTSNKRRKI